MRKSLKARGMTKRYYYCGLFVCGCLLIAGSGETRPVPVTGTVEYNGQPLTDGDVFFVPVSPNEGQAARGKIGPDGRFELATDHAGEGAFPGEYKVTVFSHGPMREVTGPGTAAPAVGDSLIPTRYNNARTTDLQETVSEEGAEVKLVLTD